MNVRVGLGLKCTQFNQVVDAKHMGPVQASSESQQLCVNLCISIGRVSRAALQQQCLTGSCRIPITLSVDDSMAIYLC